ncbi:MAG: aldose epimerase family protein [Chitinophagales bacterium]
MHPGQQYCFTHSSGEDIYLFALQNTKGTEVLITNYGAIITAFKIKQADGSFNDIVLGFDKPEDYFSEDYLRQYPWFGCAVGRCANRIKNSSFKIGDETYYLSKNRMNDHLHGGINGFDKKIWQVISFNENMLQLKYKSPDGEEGYPGNLDVTIKFELTDSDELSYEYHAVCDQSTVANLTHHSYFNLDNGKGTINDQLVKIYSSQTLEQDENLTVTGKIIPVENTEYDFRKFRPIGEQTGMEHGYDKSFVLNKTNDVLTIAAEAYSEKSGIKLRVFTTEPIVHLYTGRWIPSVKGKDDNQYGPFSGFCLETHKHPNAINIPGFPNTILRPGEKYFQKTVYKLFQA